MNKYNYNKLTPFKWFILENFPLIDEDFDALTNWQLFCKLGKEINKIINSQNNVGEQMETVTDAFIALQDYVNNYFENLDVQDEIDNKLDDMVEQGTLQEIIASYLNSKAVFCFDNVSDMKDSANLINGSYAKTLGYYSKNDGGSAMYKIRTITNDDVVDEMLILEMTNDNTLIAELIYGEEINIKQLGAYGDSTHDDSSKIITAMSVVDKIIIPSGNYKISNNINIPRNNITIEGLSYRNATLLFDFGTCLKFEGTSILTSGGKHKDFLTINNIKLQAQNYDTINTIPFIQLICCSYVKFNNSWIAGKGKQILMWECFDSRFFNTDIEWGGSDTDANNFGIELRSTNGGDSSLPSYEYTNNIYFYGCRFESHLGTCIGSTGNNTSKITFTSCKFESFNCLTQRAISFIHAVSVYFTDCIFAGDLGNTKNYLYIDQTTDFKIDGFGEHITAHSLAYSGKRLIYASGSGKRIINLNLNNNGAYDLDQSTFGIDTWGRGLYTQASIHVNNVNNENILLTSNVVNVATLNNGDTTLNYTVLDNGFLHVTFYGAADNGPHKITVHNGTKGMDSSFITIGSMYNTGMCPVSKGDVLTCTGNTTAWAQIKIYYNRG